MQKLDCCNEREWEKRKKYILLENLGSRSKSAKIVQIHFSKEREENMEVFMLTITPRTMIHRNLR